MRRTTRQAARVAAGTVALLVAGGLLAACGGDAEEPSSTSSAESEGTPADDAEPESPDESSSDETGEDTGEEVTADTPPTPPGTVLDADETAVVELPYETGGRGLYAVDLVSVEEAPLSDLPPEVPTEPGSTLWYVDQDYTMLDRGTGDIAGLNLSGHTSVSVGDDFQVPMLFLTDTPDCEIATFTAADGRSGKTRRSCSAYLLQRGESVRQVWFFERGTDYDLSTGGDPVRWRVGS